MSTDWNIECRKCGYRVFDEFEHRLKAYLAVEVCCSDRLVYVQPSGWWRTIVQAPDPCLSIDLSDIPTNCTHDFEPRNEYGKWATPDMWPDGHPKSMVMTSELTGQCTAGGESRCG